MQKIFNPFTLVLTGILGSAYFYLAFRLLTSLWAQLLLALPFLCIWIVPILYWGTDKNSQSRLDEWLHLGAYLSVGWLNFSFFLTVFRDLLWLAAGIMQRPELQSLLMDPGPRLL